MRIDSSGKVGVGTTSPAGTFDVSGNARIGAGSGGNFENAGTRLLVANTGGDAYIQIQAADSTGTSGLKFGRNSVANRAGIDWSASTDALQFRTGGTTERMRIASNGNVGIGTSSPSELLHIAGATNPAITLQDTTNNTDARIKTNNNGDLVFEADYNNEQGDSRIGFEVDGSERMRIASSGRLGIGTTSPAEKLHVVGDIRIEDTSPRLGFHDSNAGSLGNTSGGFETFDSSGNRSIFVGSVDAGGHCLIGTNNTERLRVTTSGDVGIGTTSPREKLHVSGSGDMKIELETTGNDNVGLEFKSSASNFIIQGGNAAGNGLRFVDIQGSSNERMRILSSGGLTFNGDTAAANALDDYEEGTWTPVFGSTGGDFTSITYSLQVGNYTKIGNRVYFECRLQKSAHTLGTASGGLLVSGLPYVVHSPTGIGGSVALSNIDIPTSVVNLALESRENASQFYAGLYTRDNTTFGNITPANLKSGTSEVRASGFYYTNT